jgi:DNA (cytosine-5)-methyltransferase 1
LETSHEGEPQERQRTRGESGTRGVVDWGKYASAINRWQIITRPAPTPTARIKDRDRLNPVFVEWMMGLPEGHVTGHGLSAAQELKMLGNGVVPQQAALALRLLGVR